MLTLARKNHETLYIGDDIAITVLDVVGNQIRLGITAPKEVVVLREELIEEREPWPTVYGADTL